METVQLALQKAVFGRLPCVHKGEELVTVSLNANVYAQDVTADCIGLHVSYQAGSKHQQACCNQQMQTEGSKQSLVLDNADDPLHRQLLAPEDKL